MRSPHFYVVKNLKNAMACLGHGDTKETLTLLKRTRDISKGWAGQTYWRVWNEEYNGRLDYKDFMSVCQCNASLPDRYYEMIGCRTYAKTVTYAKRYGSSDHIADALGRQAILEFNNQQEKQMKPAKGYIVINTTSVFTGDGSPAHIPPQSRPTKIHATKLAATTEAERLAKVNVGSTFMVFGTVAAKVVKEPVTSYTY